MSSEFLSAIRLDGWGAVRVKNVGGLMSGERFYSLVAFLIVDRNGFIKWIFVMIPKVSLLNSS